MHLRELRRIARAWTHSFEWLPGRSFRPSYLQTNLCWQLGPIPDIIRSFDSIWFQFPRFGP